MGWCDDIKSKKYNREIHFPLNIVQKNFIEMKKFMIFLLI